MKQLLSILADKTWHWARPQMLSCLFEPRLPETKPFHSFEPVSVNIHSSPECYTTVSGIDAFQIQPDSQVLQGKSCTHTHIMTNFLITFRTDSFVLTLMGSNNCQMCGCFTVTKMVREKFLIQQWVCLFSLMIISDCKGETFPIV